MEDTVSYKQSWTLRQILNDDNFDNIIWDVDSSKDGGKQIMFVGTAKNSDVNTTVGISFALADGAEDVPFATDIIIKANGETTAVGMQEFQDMGYEFADALAYGEASIVTYLVLFSDEAIK